MKKEIDPKPDDRQERRKAGLALMGIALPFVLAGVGAGVGSLVEQPGIGSMVGFGVGAGIDLFVILPNIAIESSDEF